MANDRSIDLILKAQVDQALQPLAQVTERVRDLIAVLVQQQAATKTGDTTLGEYAKALRDVERASGDLLKARGALENFQTRQNTLDAKQSATGIQRQARDDLAASLPAQGERTNAQSAALERLNTKLAASERQASSAAIAYQKAVDQLQRLGVLTDALAASEQRLRLDQAGSDISQHVLLASEALRAGQATNDTLISTLRLAGAERQAAEDRRRYADQQVADQARVLKAAEEVRTKGAASQSAVDQQSPLNIRRFEVEETFRQAAEDEKLAKQRAANATAYQAEQARLAAAVGAVWDEEAAGAEKARQAMEAFRARVQEATAEAKLAAGQAAGQTQALGRPVPLPAPTLAAQVRTALAGSPGPGTGTSDLPGLQSEIAGITVALTTGSLSAKEYAAQLRSLDAVAKEVARQAGIVDGFTKQRDATQFAIDAYKLAEQELARLRTSLASVGDDAQLSEVTSQIARLQAKIGQEGGNGLASTARQQIVALDAERLKLQSIGIAMDEVGTASARLTEVATKASEARAAATVREREEIEKERIAIQARAGVTSARVASGVAPQAAAPLASDRVNSILSAVPDREGIAAMGDAATAADNLQKSLASGLVTSGTYQHNMEKIYAVQRLIAADAGLIDRFNAQKVASAQAAEAFTLAETELAMLVAEAAKGTVSFGDLTAAEQRFTAAAARVDAANVALAKSDSALKTRKIDTDNLTAATDRLAAASLKVANVSAGQKSSGFLGLQPYQLKNLEYQIGDVYTQLSLGQGLFRTFNSQADQIFQLWDVSVSKLKLFALYGVPAAAALYLVYEAMAHTADTIAAQRTFQAQLDATADGAAYQAAELVKAQHELERYGVSAKDAGDGIRLLMRDGFNVDQIIRFQKTAQGLVDLFGLKFPEAMKLVKEAATGTFNEIVKLNETGPVRFLDTDQQERMRALADAGKLDEFRAVAIDALNKAADHGKEALGPWAQGMREVAGAWNGLLRAMADENTIKKTNAGIIDLTHTIARMFDAMAKSTNKEFVASIEKELDTYGTTGIERLAVKWGSILGKALGDAVTAAHDGGVGPTGAPAAGQGAGGAPKYDVSAMDAIVYKFVQNGVALNDAIAFAANALRESGGKWNGPAGDPDIKAGTDSQGRPYAGGSHGLFQINRERLAGFQQQNNGQLPEQTSLDAQVKFAVQEYLTTHAAAKTAVENEAEVGAKAAALTRLFEVPKDIPGQSAISEKIARDYAASRNIPVGTATVPGTAPAGVGTPQAGSDANAAQNKQAADRIRDETASRRDRNAEDDQWQREFQAQITEEHKRLIEEAQALVKAPGGLSPETLAAIDLADKDFASKLKAVHQKRIDALQEAADKEVRTLREQLDRLDKTDPVKQRAAVNLKFDALAQSDQATIKKGGTEALGPDGGAAINAAREQLRKEELEAVTIAADSAAVVAKVKARDETIAGIETELKNGTIGLAEAFRRVAEVVKQFLPEIQDALRRSNADLASQPVTPKIQAAQAANAKVDQEDNKAFETVDKAAAATIATIEAARNDKVKTYNDLVTQGSMTQQNADKLQIAEYNVARPQIAAIATELQKQIDLQLSLGQITQETYDKMSAGIKKSVTASNDLTKTQQMLAKTIDDSILNHAIQGFDTITTAIGAAIAGTGTWGEAIRSFGVAFAQMAAGVLKDIATMILKQEILNALQGAGGGGSGGSLGGIISKLLGGGGTGADGIAAGTAGSAGSGAAADAALSESSIFADVTTTFAHGGGMVGSLGMSRAVNPAAFIGAPRMHGGGLVGLNDNERATVLQVGEEVLTADDPRHKNNQVPTSSTAQAQSIRNVMLFDENEVAGAMAGSAGEQVTFTHIKRNLPAIRQLLGVK